MIMHILKSNAMKRCLPAILSGMLLAACSVAEPPREQLSVSIEPLNFLTRQIAATISRSTYWSLRPPVRKPTSLRRLR